MLAEVSGYQISAALHKLSVRFQKFEVILGFRLEFEFCPSSLNSVSNCLRVIVFLLLLILTSSSDSPFLKIYAVPDCGKFKILYTSCVDGE